MKRREFLKMSSFVTVSVAALGVTACGSDDSSNSGGIAPNPVRPMPPAATGANWKFPQSIATGDPRSDSIMFWTRVVPNNLSITDVTTISAAIQLKVTKDVANATNLSTTTALTGALVADVTVPAYSDFDGTVRHKLTGLEANTVYFYQFVAGDVRSNVGRMKTAPAASSTADVKFAFMSCQDWNANHWGAFSQIVTDDGPGSASPSLDFIVHLGDYIYENATDTVKVEAAHTVLTLPGGGSNASGTNQYRYLYKTYRSDTRLQNMHERFPVIAIWDDHEFSDDCWQDHETYTNANASQSSRRRSANQAWFEFTPADITYSENDPGFQNIKIYRDLKFGQTVHLVMTDERLYRADHMIPETTASPLTNAEIGRVFSRYLAPEPSYKLVESIKYGILDDPLGTMTMLGTTQRAWWKSTMAGSTAKWKVWGNEVSLLRMGLQGTKAAATLVALQTIRDTPGLMASNTSNTSIQGMPVAAAGAGAAVMGGASPSIAIPASVVMLQTYFATGNVGQAVAAGQAAGLTNAQATSAMTAIGAKTPTAREIGICAATTVAGTSIIMTTNMSQANASTAAGGATIAMLLTDALAGGAAPDANLLAAAKGTSTISDAAGTIVVSVYKAAKAAADAGSVVAPTTQTNAGGAAFTSATNAPQVLGLVRTEVETYKKTSAFVIASGKIDLLGQFFRKFLLNADQWDGYGKERKELMNHLLNNNIKNVVAVTGDIHAFYAGKVYNDFPGEVSSFTVQGADAVETGAYASGSPAMIDLVTAGISSTSWYEYLKAAATSLSSDLANLVSLKIPAGAANPATGAIGLPFDLNIPVLDFTMGKAVNAANLFAVARDSLKLAAAAAGVPESALAGSGGVNGIASSIAGSGSFQLLCSALSYVGAENGWLQHVDTNAQGYAVVTASSSSLTCKFTKLNTLFTSGATSFVPGTVPGSVDARAIVTSTTTVTLDPNVALTASGSLVVGATTPVS